MAGEVRKRFCYIGPPDLFKLEQFGRYIRDALDEVPYLVGSCLHREDWRDVDVRVILPDEKYDALFGERTVPACLSAKWNAWCLAFAALGRDTTGLPIDFQIDRMTEANAQYDGPRNPLGVFYGRA
jgi:hypothetical protein